MDKKGNWMVHATVFVTIAGVLGSESCCKKTDAKVDCTNCNLTSIPASLLDNATTDLLLANNSIYSIPNGTFINCTSLVRLVLTNNPLRGLNAKTFQGLELLQHLEIGPRVMRATVEPLPAYSFNPLGNIRKLLLYYTYPTEVPVGIFKTLTKLEALVMSMEVGSTLGSEFTKLKQLKSLHIIRLTRCLEYVTLQTFATVPQLDKLQITSCIRDIDADAFIHFTSLHSLVLPCNGHLSVPLVMTAIRNMKTATLKTLVLDACRSHGSGQSKLTYELGPANLNSSSFTKLTNLSLRCTGLISVDNDLIYQIPNIRHINFGINSIFKSKFHKNEHAGLQQLNDMRIESIDASYMFSHCIPSKICQINPWETEMRYFRQPPSIIKPAPQMPKQNRTVVDEMLQNIPPTLHYVYTAHWGDAKKYQTQEFNADNNILYIDMSYGRGQRLPLIKGLNKLQGFDGNNNKLHYIEPNFLHYFPSLKYLNLGHNKLGNIDLVKSLGPGSLLQWLDLSYNNFHTIPSNLMNYLPNIINISFSGNPLINVRFDMHNNTKLEVLDLSNCALVNLTHTFMKELDDLQSKVNHSLNINLSQNGFECSCSTLDMVLWFKRTAVNIIDRQTINCAYRNTSVAIVSLDDKELSKKCLRVGHIISMVTIVLPPVGIVSLMSFLLVVLYQFRWHVRWYVYRIRRTIRYNFHRRPTADILLSAAEDSHAFVAYNHTEDCEWVINDLMPVIEEQWGLRLLIGQRDFIVGKPIAENIADAIDSSRKTILVITPAFTESQWCEFEMQMALVKGLSCLIIIYKEEVPVSKMSKTLKMLMKSVNYIEYAQEAQDLFWDKLRISLNKLD